MPERGPKVKPKMDKPKGHLAGQTMPREVRRKLMKEYMAKGLEAAERYGAGVGAAADDGGSVNSPQNSGERQAVQQVEDTLYDGAQSAGRGVRSAAKQGKDRFVQGQRQKKARKEYVVEKAGKAAKIRSAEQADDAYRTANAGRVRDMEHGGSAAASAGKTGKSGTTNTGGKKMPKSKAGLFSQKGKQSARLAKIGKPGLKTSKAALGGRKVAKGAATQLKRRAAQAARAAARRSARAARFVARMLIQAAKAVVKVLMLIVSAAGPFVLILIAFAGIAMMIASPFGLFFSGEDTGGGIAPISAVIREVAADFNSQMLDIQNGNTWDELQVHYEGKRGSNWRDVLAVFAVKTTLLDENAADVVTINADKAERIRAVFWDMTELSHRIEEIEHHDEDTGLTTYTYILHITITQQDANTQADSYAFTQDQREVLAEMLGGAYDEYFRTLIGGAGELGGGTPVVGTGSYIWPSDSGSAVTSYFGLREHPITGEQDDHTGIDISAGYGTNVLAADAGRVVTAEWHWSYGNYIVIDHGDGRQTLYAHMSLLIASPGQDVAQGEVIGLVGATGMADGDHVHFETYVNGSKVDPLSYFSGYG